MDKHTREYAFVHFVAAAFVHHNSAVRAINEAKKLLELAEAEFPAEAEYVPELAPPQSPFQAAAETAAAAAAPSGGGTIDDVVPAVEPSKPLTRGKSKE